MAMDKQHQIALVRSDGTVQLPFPGGWILAMFAAMDRFAPGLASTHRPTISRRTAVRIGKGDSVKQLTYDGIELQLVAVVTELFPSLARVEGFLAAYVREYFQLWAISGVAAPAWAQSFGFEPTVSGVLARPLLRDLVLRICYLESCERNRRSTAFGTDELALLRHDSPHQVYGALIASQKSRHGLTTEGLAVEIKSYEEKLRRLKRGMIASTYALLKSLSSDRTDTRVLVGIGYIDAVAREIGLDSGVALTDCMHAAEVLLAQHPCALRTEDLESCACLLLHPGVQEIRPKMPSALWRAHLFTLQYARLADLAQAYFQCANEENDRDLELFLSKAEGDSGGSPNHWMRALQKPSNITPFPGNATDEC